MPGVGGSEKGHENPQVRVDGAPKEIRNDGLPNKCLGLYPSTSLLDDILHMSQYSFCGHRLQRLIFLIFSFYDALSTSGFIRS